MAFDTVVDGTQLEADLTSVANAIRAKTGGSADLTFPSGFVSAIAGVPSDGIATGRFTPVSSTYEPGKIEVDNPWTNLILFALESNGYVSGIRTIRRAQFFVIDDGLGFYIDNSNSAGTAAATYNKPEGESDRFAKDGTDLTISSSSSIGYFAAGVTYVWFAWNETEEDET